MSDNKERQVNIRFSEEEYALVKSKANKVGMKISTFLRQAAMNGEVKYITNGHKIVKSIGNFHNEMQNIQKNMTQEIDFIKSGLKEISETLRQHTASTNSEFLTTIKWRLDNIDMRSQIISNDYIKQQNQIDESLHNICKNILQ